MVEQLAGSRLSEKLEAKRQRDNLIIIPTYFPADAILYKTHW